ncbi:dTDP-4-dehydrorhamnose reductase [bacterium]|nr:dTDP-4-dehydrorhamnose reductase [bacterium]
MKIVVMGAEGQVGTFLLRKLSARHEVIGTALQGMDGLQQVDICDLNAVEQHLKEVRPDYVILTAAMTHVDRCEELPEAAERINVKGTENVANVCKAMNAGMAYFSTDYVFDGVEGPYAEEDKPYPLSVYGKTKLQGEMIVRNTVANHLIIRPMFIFSYLPGSMNFFMQISQRLDKGEPITVPDDQLGNPIEAGNLAAALGELIERQCTGIYHLAGLSRVSKAAWARQIVSGLGQDPNCVRMVATSELGQRAPRPLNSGLKTEKAQQVLRENPLWNLGQALIYACTQRREMFE